MEGMRAGYPGCDHERGHLRLARSRQAKRRSRHAAPPHERRAWDQRGRRRFSSRYKARDEILDNGLETRSRRLPTLVRVRATSAMGRSRDFRRGGDPHPHGQGGPDGPPSSYPGGDARLSKPKTKETCDRWQRSPSRAPIPRTSSEESMRTGSSSFASGSRSLPLRPRSSARAARVGLRVGHRDHVRLLDPVEPRDRRAVESHPSESAPSSSSRPTEKLFSWPLMSVNQKRMNSTPSSSTLRRMSSGSVRGLVTVAICRMSPLSSVCSGGHLRPDVSLEGRRGLLPVRMRIASSTEVTDLHRRRRPNPFQGRHRPAPRLQTIVENFAAGLVPAGEPSAPLVPGPRSSGRCIAWTSLGLPASR